MIPRELNRSMVEQLLNLKRDKRYRSGVIQLACLLEIISHEEWIALDAQIRCGSEKLKIG